MRRMMSGPPPPGFSSPAEWLHSLGDVPIERVIFQPLPGMATEADLLRFAERDKRLCELIDATLVEKPVGFWHSLIGTKLIGRLALHADSTGAGVVFGANAPLRMPSCGRIRLPDGAFISAGRAPRLPDPIPTVAPDIAVEVLSATNTKAEMAQKLREYFESGTRLAWFIDQDTRTVAVYYRPGEPVCVLAETDTLDGDQVLPGFSMPVAELFRNVPRS